ncbi:MAG: hypothetical protein LiPW41_357 [Parcubacteria group bacterium LiPW_41]|nr:MAG: hypothetical protein LiPW41_357 [Parcubacteria group bacterium LiPW_41]
MDNTTKFFESIRSSEVATLRNQIENQQIEDKVAKKKLLEIKEKIENTESFKNKKDSEFMIAAQKILNEIDTLISSLSPMLNKM